MSHHAPRWACVLAGLCAWLSVLGGCAAVPLPSASAGPRGAPVAAAHGVQFPVDPDRVGVDGRDPQGRAREIFGEVVVEPGRAAALWISALEVVRVTSPTSESAQRLQFSRLVAGNGDRGLVRVDEPGIVVSPRVHYLVGPPGGGSSWLVTADRPGRVSIERLVDPSGRLVWEAVEVELRRWAREGGALPALPAHAEAKGAAFRLIAMGELRDELLAGAEDPAIRAATTHWLEAEVGRQVERMRPRIAPYYDRVDLDRRLESLGPRRRLADGRSRLQAAWYRLVETSSWQTTVTRAESGELNLIVRPMMLVSDEAQPPTTRTVSVRVGGQVIASEVLLVEPASMTGPLDALPTDGPARTLAGEVVGAARHLRVHLPNTKQDVELEVSGGSVLLRAQVARRRPWARLGEEAWIDAAVARGRAELAGRSDRLGLAVMALLDHAATEGPLVESQRMPVQLRPAVKLVAESEHWPTATDVVAARSAPALAAWARAERWSHAGPPPVISARFVRPALSEYLDDLRLPRVDGAQASAQLGLAEYAWRRAPGSGEQRRRYLQAWYRDSHWARLPAAVVEGGRDRAASRLRWVVAPSSDTAPTTEPKARYRWPVTPGRPFVLDVAPPLAAAQRARVVELLTISRADEPTFVTVRVDGRPWSFAAMPGAERVRFTMDPGVHQVHVEHSEDVSIFAPTRALHETAPARPAELRSLVPVVSDDGSPVRFRRPAGHAPGPVRVRVRALLPEGEATFGERPPLRATIRSDVGFSQTITLDGLAVDTNMLALDGERAVSQAFDVVLWPPAVAWEFWIEPAASEQPLELVATVAVRADVPAVPLEVDAPEAASSPDRSTAPVPEPRGDRLRTVSARLGADPMDHGIRLRRARSLLDLGEHKHAWADVRFVAEHRDELPTVLRQRLDRLLAELEAQREPSSLPVGPQIRPGRVEAASPFVVTGPAPKKSAPVGSAHALALTARQAERSGRFTRAAALYAQLHRDTGQWRHAVGFAEMFEQVLQDPGGQQAAPFIYGATKNVRDAGLIHPSISRVHFAALRASKWERGTKPDRAAGYEWLIRRPTDAPPGTPIAIRSDLAAAPWPQWQGHVLRRQQVAALATHFRESRTVRAEVVCRRLHGVSEEPGCPMVVTVDGVARVSKRVASGEHATLTIGEFLAGEHEFEVQLATDERDVLAATRVTSARASGGEFEPMRGVIRGRRLVARGGTPVAMTLRGPTTVEVSVRGIGAAPPAAATVVATAVAGPRFEHEMELVTRRDRAASIERSARTSVSDKTTLYLPLPNEQDYTVEVRVPRGEALVRLRQRRARDESLAAPAKPQLPRPVPMADGVHWSGQTERLALLSDRAAGEQHNRFGTLSVTALAAVDAVEDRDVRDESPSLVRAELLLAYQRAVLGGRLRFDLGPRVGVRDRTGGIAGGDAAAMLATRRGLHLSLEGRALAQSFLGAAAVGTATRLRVGRRIRLAHRWSLTPAVASSYRTQSLAPSSYAYDPQAADPRVYSVYYEQHPLAVSPLVTLRWTPTMTQAVSLRPSATLNSDLRSFDRVDIRVGWRGVLPTQHAGDFVLGAHYGPSFRLADAHRAAGYVRNDLRLEVFWSAWTGRAGRVLIGARNSLFLYDSLDLRNTFRVTVRYDLSRGRGLYDLRPRHALFREVTGRRYWQEEYDDAR